MIFLQNIILKLHEFCEHIFRKESNQRDSLLQKNGIPTFKGLIL